MAGNGAFWKLPLMSDNGRDWQNKRGFGATDGHTPALSWLDNMSDYLWDTALEALRAINSKPFSLAALDTS
jgi:hypothetical protein